MVSLRPETCDVATRVLEHKSVKSTELDIVSGTFCNLCALALLADFTYLRYPLLTSPKRGETSVC